jgi:hypothetical protein
MHKKAHVNVVNRLYSVRPSLLGSRGPRSCPSNPSCLVSVLKGSWDCYAACHKVFEPNRVWLQNYHMSSCEVRVKLSYVKLRSASKTIICQAAKCEGCPSNPSCLVSVLKGNWDSYAACHKVFEPNRVWLQNYHMSSCE